MAAQKRTDTTAALAAAASCVIERLETRQLLSAVAIEIQGDIRTLTITGTDSPDRITVEADPRNPALLRAVMNGKRIARVSIDQIDRIIVRGQAGDDRILVRMPRPCRNIRARVYGGPGNDTLIGGIQNDELIGGPGNDLIAGGAGDDVLWGGAGKNVLVGGSGRDEIPVRPQDQIAADSADAQPPQVPANSLVHSQDLSALRAWAIDQAVAQWKDRLGQKYTPPSWNPIEPPTVIDAFIEIQPGAATPFLYHRISTGGPLQEPLMTNDGRYVYLARAASVGIIDAAIPEQPQIIAQLHVEHEVEGVFVDGDRLAVLSRHYTSRPWPVINLAPEWADNALPSAGDYATDIALYDISDRTAPRLISSSLLPNLPSILPAMRFADGRLYMVFGRQVVAPEPYLVREAVFRPELPGTAIVYHYESEADYRARLRAIPLEDLLGGPVSSMYAPVDGPAEKTITTVMMMNLRANTAEPQSQVSLLGVHGATVASSDHAYIAYFDRSPTTGEKRTNVYSLSLGSGGVDVQASAAVPGWPIGNDPMDVHGDDLRIATSSSLLDRSTTNLTILRDSCGRLTPVGGLFNFKAAHPITDVRFVNDLAFLGTGDSADPLLIADLADPAEARLAGKLRLPTSSSYLLGVGEDRLLSIGYDGVNSSPLEAGVHAMLYDLSSLKHPRLVGQYAIGTPLPGQAADFQEPHRSAWWKQDAFAWFADREQIVLPVIEQGYAGYHDGQYDGWYRNQLAISIDVDRQNGLTELGRTAVDVSSMYAHNVRIGDNLYWTDGQSLKVVGLSDPSRVLAEVPLVNLGW